MLAWLVNKLWPLLEPKIKEIVDEAVDRAVSDLTAVAAHQVGSVIDAIDLHIQSTEDQVLAALRKLPIVGGLI